MFSAGPSDGAGQQGAPPATLYSGGEQKRGDRRRQRTMRTKIDFHARLKGPPRLRALSRLLAVGRQAYGAYGADDCQQSAAAIAYYVLFSTIPLAIFLVSVFGFALDSSRIRNTVVDFVVENANLSEPDGRRQVEDALDTVRGAAAALTVVGVAGTLLTASSVFAATRKALNRVWGVRENRAFLKQKLVDLAQMGVLFLLLIASVLATGALRTLRQVTSRDLLAFLHQANPLWEVPTVLLPALLTFAAFSLVYRYVPAYRPRWRPVLAGAGLATVLFEVLKNTFALYVAHFNNFHLIYGSLAALLLFLFYVYLGANVLLLGAELSKLLSATPSAAAVGGAAATESSADR